MQAFVAAYLACGDPEASAEAAGVPALSARKFLASEEVQAAIKAQLAADAIQYEGLSKRVIEELTVIAFSDVNHYTVTGAGTVTLKEGAPEGASRAVMGIERTVRKGGVEYRLKLWPKTVALELLAKHLGLLLERRKIDIEHHISGSVSVKDATDDDLYKVIAAHLQTAAPKMLEAGPLEEVEVGNV